MLLDVFLFRQDYEHVNTVFKSWCGMITFLYRLFNGPSLIPGTSVTAYYLSNGLKGFPDYYYSFNGYVAYREQQSLNRIFIIVIARVTVPVYFIHSYPVYSLLYSFLTIDLISP